MVLEATGAVELDGAGVSLELVATGVMLEGFVSTELETVGVTLLGASTSPPSFPPQAARSKEANSGSANVLTTFFITLSP